MPEIIWDDDVVEGELASIFNRYNIDTAYNTPDFILARHCMQSLLLYSSTKQVHDTWGKVPETSITKD